MRGDALVVVGAQAAVLLSGVAADLAITQVVDGTKGVHALIAKSIFQGR